MKKTENIHQLQANKTHVDRKKNISSGNVRKNSPSKPHQYSKLSVREKEQVYLDVYDNNLQLKKKEEVLTTQIKQ